MYPGISRQFCVQNLNFSVHPIRRYEWGAEVRIMTTCARDPWLFEPHISRLRQTVEVYYCDKCQVISIRGFRLIVLTHTNKHTTRRDKVIAKSAPPYCVVSEDNHNLFTDSPLVLLFHISPLWLINSLLIFHTVILLSRFFRDVCNSSSGERPAEPSPIRTKTFFHLTERKMSFRVMTSFTWQFCCGQLMME